MESGELAFSVIMFTVVAVAWFILMESQKQKLEDPENTEVVFLDQLPDVSRLLGVGEFRLRIYRQSGNLQKDDQYFATGPEALRKAISTFKRAKIDYVVISSNESSELCFRRPYHSHRGKAEGKKVGWVEIHRTA